MLRRDFKPDLQIVDLIWIDPAAFGIAASADANVDNLLAEAADNVVLVRAGSGLARQLAARNGGKVRVVVLGERARLLRREAWVLWLLLRAVMRNRRVLYTSWMARFCLVVLLLPVKCRLFAHDLNSYRARVHDARYPQPSLLSRLHQMASIRRATQVQCFARSVARQLGLVRRDGIAVGDQTVSVIAPVAAGKRDGAVIFLDDRSYKGTWALDRFYSSRQGFPLTVIGKIDAADAARLSSRGIAVRALRPSDREKFKLLAEAEYVIFASKFEGYGLPPREAAAVGTPSLIARRAALLDIPAVLSLSIDALGDRIDLAEVAGLAAAIDRSSLRQWATAFLGPVSTAWQPSRPLQ